MDLLNFILDLVLLGIVTWFVFVWLVSRWIKLQIAQSIATDLDQERLIPLTVEVDKNQYFCYNSIDQAFVCQGFDLEEIANNFKARYPDKKMALYNGDKTALSMLKQQAENLAKSEPVQP